jgi:hypothetical protein
VSATAAPLALDPTSRALLAEAAEWRLIGRLLEIPRGDWGRDVAALHAEVGDAGLASAARAAEGASEGDYLDALGPGGRVSPREVAHVPLAQPGLLLGDVAAFYEAFAYRPALAEPLDHIAVEAAFLSFLRLKQAYAQARGQEEQAQVAAAGAARFLNEHLRPLAAAVAHGLHETPVPHLRLLAAELTRRVGPHRPRVLLAPEVDDDAGCAFDREAGADAP